MEELMNCKARIFILFGKTNEAIKVLKKVAKKRHSSAFISPYSLYLLGFLYKTENNVKEAFKWFKKVFIDLPEQRLSLSYNKIDVVFMSLYEIARIKFCQEDYQIAEMILNECHATFCNHRGIFTEYWTFCEKRSESFVDSWESRFKNTKEMLDFISEKSNDKVKHSTLSDNEDLVKVIRTLESSRRKINDEHDNHDLVLEGKIKYHLNKGENQEAIKTYQRYFEKQEQNPNIPEYNANHFFVFAKFGPYFESYCNCLFLYDMYEEALEFLHTGLQELRSILNNT